MSNKSFALSAVLLSLSALFAGCASAPSDSSAPLREFSAGFDTSPERLQDFLLEQAPGVFAKAIDDAYVTSSGYGVYADKIVRLGEEYAIASDPAFCADTQKAALTKLDEVRDQAFQNAGLYGGEERIAADYKEARRILSRLCSSPAVTLP